MRYWIVFLLLLPLVSAAPCGELHSNTALGKDVYCPDGLQLKQNVKLNCNGNSIFGDNAGVGITPSDNSRIENCNVVNYFTGISLNEKKDVTVKNVLILNTSTGIDAQNAIATLENINIRNTTYYDIYSKDSQLTTSRIDANIFNVNDDRPPEEQVIADPQNYTFIAPKATLRSRPNRALLNLLNISYQDYNNANIVQFNATAQRTEQMINYEIQLFATKPANDLSVLVYFPEEFTQYQFITGGGAVKEYPRLLRFPIQNLNENESTKLTFEVSTLAPPQEITLPVVVMSIPTPLTPSPDVTRRVAIGLFGLAAVLFILTKKFLLQQPVTPREQLSLLLGVIALWAISYKFTIKALQFTKDFIMFAIVVLLSLYYFYFIFKHREAFDKL